VFFGKSFLSPNNAVYLLYDRFPSVPGYTDTQLEDSRGSDNAACFFGPWAQSTVLHRALFVDHEWPLWNRYVSSGAPLLGQGITTFGDPLQIPALLSAGAVWSWDFHFVAGKWLLAFGLGLVVFALVGSFGAALCVAASAPFIGFFAYRLNHPALFSVCYAPWLLVCWIGIARAMSWRQVAGWVGGLVVANIALLNCGALKEASMQMAVLNGCGAAFVASSGGSLRARMGRLLAAVWGMAGFVLLTAPVWLTFYGTLKKSWTVYDAPHAWQISPTLALGLFDDIFYRQRIGADHFWNPSLNFFLLAGVLWALVSLRPLWRDRVFRVVAAGTFGCLALAFGLVPGKWIERLPFIGNIIHIDNTFSCVALVLLAVVAGYGFRAMWNEPDALRWRSRYAGMLLLLLALVWLYGSATQGIFFTALFKWYAPLLIGVVVALPLLVRLWTSNPTWRVSCMAWMAVIAVVPHARHGQHLMGAFEEEVFNPQVRADLKAPSSAVEFIRSRLTEPARTVGFGHKLYPGYNQALLLESLFGTDPLHNRHYFELDQAFGINRITNHDAGTAEESVASDRRPYDFLNVRYYLAEPEGVPAQDSGLRVAGRFDLAVYESPECWPRAFFTDALAHYSDARAFAALVRGGDGPPFAAMQEVDLPRAGEAAAALIARPFSSRTVKPASGYRLTTNTTSFDVESTGPGLVVLQETFLRKDFRVVVNGEPKDCLRVNHAFKGVYVPAAGKYHVSFEYRPADFSLALLLGAIGLGGLLAGGIVAFRARGSLV
ncbi:MAG: hypothetical protein ABIZ49_13010, partial [Opitutaceae bacterium]